MVIGKRGETILYQSDLQLRVVGQNLKNYSPSGGLEPPTFRLTMDVSIDGRRTLFHFFYI